jgi:hypothetical protein
MNKDTALEIKRIFDDNVLQDLKRFMEKRENINKYNVTLIYLFHITQSAGVFTTTIATGYNKPQFIWLGIALNILASLINIFEQVNNSISKKLLKDIQTIREGNYIDEDVIIDLDKPLNKQNSPTNDNLRNDVL